MAKKKKYTEEELKYARRQLIVFAIVAAGLFVIDIVSKWLVQSFCTPFVPIAVIPNFFYITLSYNTGAAFSLGANWGIGGRILGIMISVILSTVIIFYWIKNNKEFTNYERAVAALMSAGAVGNLIDRAFYFEAITGFDGVIDFFQFYLGGGPDSPNKNMFNPFATFNFADACLVIGIILFLIILIVQMVKQGKNSELRSDPRLAKKDNSVSSVNSNKTEETKVTNAEPSKETKPNEEDEEDEDEEE